MTPLIRPFSGSPDGDVAQITVLSPPPPSSPGQDVQRGAPVETWLRSPSCPPPPPPPVRPFSVEPRCGTLAAGDVAQITVQFRPTAVGQHCEHALLTYDNGKTAAVTQPLQLRSSNVHVSVPYGDRLVPIMTGLRHLEMLTAGRFMPPRSAQSPSWFIHAIVLC